MMKTCSIRWLLLGTAVLWLTSGCAATSSPTLSNPPRPVMLAPVPEGYGWWYVRFRMDRPAEETRWERDLQTAHQVANSLIRAHERDIDLWRFHRRSAEDETGHQLSFLFCSSAAVAEKINQISLEKGIANDPSVEQLLEHYEQVNR